MHMCHREAQLPRYTQRSSDMLMALILTLAFGAAAQLLALA